jgi:hypothetical protein
MVIQILCSFYYFCHIDSFKKWKSIVASFLLTIQKGIREEENGGGGGREARKGLEYKTIFPSP